MVKVSIFPLYFSDVNECAPAPCQNGATCVDLVGRYRCDCVTGYSGNNCETSTNFISLINVVIRVYDILDQSIKFTFKI